AERESLLGKTNHAAPSLADRTSYANARSRGAAVNGYAGRLTRAEYARRANCRASDSAERAAVAVDGWWDRRFHRHTRGCFETPRLTAAFWSTTRLSNTLAGYNDAITAEMKRRHGRDVSEEAPVEAR